MLSCSRSEIKIIFLKLHFEIGEQKEEEEEDWTANKNIVNLFKMYFLLLFFFIFGKHIFRENKKHDEK